MRSLYTKIQLWLLGTIVAAMAGSIATSWMISRTIRRDDPFARTLNLQLDAMRRAYESGGKEEAASQENRISEFFPGRRYFVDENGKDLVTGEDRRQLMARAHTLGQLPRPLQAGTTLIIRSADKKYALMVLPRVNTSFWSNLPYHLWILLAVAVAAYIFTRHLVKPLRDLRDTLERFGRGDLGARTGLARKDELGDVSRAFDDMAGRIETLLTAERRLLQDISHELRSPLARLGFAIELAKTSPDRDAAIERIRREVDRLNLLVGQLLQVTRAEGDPAAREMESVALDALLRDVAEDSAWEAELRHVRIISRIGEQMIVRGDRELLRRAIENVVRNALLHAPEGTAVEIGLETSKDGAKIKVRDEGPGVAEENLEQIFKPFFREDSSRNSSTGGLGLGLAIAYRAINLHHGRVRAENVSPGLLVEIELPAAA